jgi:hypothetical protein
LTIILNSRNKPRRANASESSASTLAGKGSIPRLGKGRCRTPHFLPGQDWPKEFECYPLIQREKDDFFTLPRGLCYNVIISIGVSENGFSRQETQLKF